MAITARTRPPPLLGSCRYLAAVGSRMYVDHMSRSSRCSAHRVVVSGHQPPFCNKERNYVTRSKCNNGHDVSPNTCCYVRHAAGWEPSTFCREEARPFYRKSPGKFKSNNLITISLWFIRKPQNSFIKSPTLIFPGPKLYLQANLDKYRSSLALDS